MKTVLIALLCLFSSLQAKVEVGIDRLFNEEYRPLLKGKKVGLITNQTGINSTFKSTIQLFKERHRDFTLVALFSPEHGLNGASYAAENVADTRDADGMIVYSLHGKTRRPTEKMLKGIDVLVYDIQEIGCRSYTYASTLFYAMEEAAKHKITVIVLDRPNPINGVIVDGPMMKEQWRSFLGYINIPYCHGMTIGELAHFFNEEYNVKCKLHVIPMSGWKREMSFKETGLPWIPPSPYIPEPDTPLFNASTGILGDLAVVNIGIGYTLPFKIVGAPWINGEEFAARLNAQKLPGVKFVPFYYSPFYGSFKNKECQGVKIIVTDPLKYRPVAVQYLLLGLLKTLYPKEVQKKVQEMTESQKRLFCQVNGNEEILSLLLHEKYIAWPLIHFQEEERHAFLQIREKYLLY